MTRAYIRLDPAFDERKEAYPDGPYAALVATFCLAELQPDRGRFRSFDYLSRLLGRRGRHARYLMDRGDIVALDDGRIYVDGWDEWQEGDWKVAERVRRIRSRRGVTPDVTVPVTPDVTPDRKAVAEHKRSDSRALAPQAGPRADDDDPAVAYWELTGRFPTEKTLGWLDDLSLKFGSPAVLRALANAYIADRSTQSLLGRTQDRLRAEARELDRQERADEQARLKEKRAKPPKVDQWLEEYRRSIEEKYGDAA